MRQNPYKVSGRFSRDFPRAAVNRRARRPRGRSLAEQIPYAGCCERASRLFVPRAGFVHPRTGARRFVAASAPAGGRSWRCGPLKSNGPGARSSLRDARPWGWIRDLEAARGTPGRLRTRLGIRFRGEGREWWIIQANFRGWLTLLRG